MSTFIADLSNELKLHQKKVGQIAYCNSYQSNCTVRRVRSDIIKNTIAFEIELPISKIPEATVDIRFKADEKVITYVYETDLVFYDNQQLAKQLYG